MDFAKKKFLLIIYGRDFFQFKKLHFSQLFIFLFITNLKEIVLYIIFRLEEKPHILLSFLKNMPLRKIMDRALNKSYLHLNIVSQCLQAHRDLSRSAHLN